MKDSTLVKKKKTASSGLQYPGKDYFINAAKQFIWPCDHDTKVIFVPGNQLPEALSDLMVNHVRSFGYHIQSEIPAGYAETKLFKPAPFLHDSKGKTLLNDGFLIGQSFTIVSTGTIVKITKREKDGSLALAYTNRYGKEPFNTKIDNVKKLLVNKAWAVIV